MKKLQAVRGLAVGLALLGSAYAGRRPILETSSACIPVTEAKSHMGKKQCVSGKVLHVSESPSGMTFLDFCEDAFSCPFTVVVFPEDLRHLGDLNQLIGKTVEVRGKIKDYDGHAEILLEDGEQLGGEVKKLPPVPKEFDVERQGKFSPGKFRAPKNRKSHPKRAKLPSETTIDVEGGLDD